MAVQGQGIARQGRAKLGWAGAERGRAGQGREAADWVVRGEHLGLQGQARQAFCLAG